MMPTQDDLLAPIVTLMKDGEEHDLSAIKESLSLTFHLTPEERAILLPKNTSTRKFDNRVLWAIQNLKSAGLVVSTRRAVYRLTEDGLSLSLNVPKRIDRPYLIEHYQKAKDYFTRIATSRDSAESETPVADATIDKKVEMSETPEERITQAIEELQEKLKEDILTRLSQCDPTVYEVLITRLLVKMGYARSEEDILQLHGRSGDGGIDGIVQRDPLGLEQVCMQAKRWSNPVPLSFVVDFYEKVRHSTARLGVFVANSGFTQDARNWIESEQYPEHRQAIAWIDGNDLTQHMIVYSIGVRQSASYLVQTLDDAAFEFEEE